MHILVTKKVLYLEIFSAFTSIARLGYTLCTQLQELLRLGKTGRYLIPNYGVIHPSTHPDQNSFILRFLHTDFHNTFVTFDIDASDLQFVVNRASGRIVDVTASDFTINEDNGMIVVTVENTGQIAGDFQVTLAHCHDDRVPSSKLTSLDPGQVTDVTFIFQAFVKEDQIIECVGRYMYAWIL